jgi:hypothetical protein
VNIYSLIFVMAKKRFGSDIRREQIAEAALDIVRSQGIKALNIAAVAEKMDMVPSALYRHFNAFECPFSAGCEPEYGSTGKAAIASEATY